MNESALAPCIVFARDPQFTNKCTSPERDHAKVASLLRGFVPPPGPWFCVGRLGTAGVVCCTRVVLALQSVVSQFAMHQDLTCSRPAVTRMAAFVEALLTGG